jgi:hypothetical protein
MDVSWISYYVFFCKVKMIGAYSHPLIFNLFDSMVPKILTSPSKPRLLEGLSGVPGKQMGV